MTSSYLRGSGGPSSCYKQSQASACRSRGSAGCPDFGSRGTCCRCQDGVDPQGRIPGAEGGTNRGRPPVPGSVSTLLARGPGNPVSAGEAPSPGWGERAAV